MVPDFKNPLFLLLLIPLAAACAWYYWNGMTGRESGVGVSSISVISAKQSWRSRTYPFLSVLRVLVLVLLVVSLARPGERVNYTSFKDRGINIMVVLDVSTSMKAEDFKPKHRLQVAKQVVQDFISRRTHDRLGLVAFAGDAWLQCPLTTEHEMVQKLVGYLEFASPQEDGTAIGDALALAASRMKDDETKEGVILLLTDGVNNRGMVDPETAARMCSDMGIRIHAVAIGSSGAATSPRSGIFGGGLRLHGFDPDALRQLTTISGGKFYMADSSGVLWEHMKQIDALEKKEFTRREYSVFHDGFRWWLYAAAMLLALELLLRSLVYRKVP